MGTRAVIEASRHDGGDIDRKRGVKAVGNVRLDNKVSWQHALERGHKLMKIRQKCSQDKSTYHLRLNLYGPQMQLCTLRE